MKGGVYKDTKGYRVKYPVKGSKPIQKRFGQDLFAAERFLNGLRWKEDNNELDPRDYQAGNPMGFTNISNAYLKLRKNQVRCFRLLEHHIEDAQNFFGNKNIKHIQYADLEDLFIQIQASRSLTSKTIYNIRTTLHALFVWAAKKFKIDMPEFPSIKVNLGWRATVDKTTQQAIIDKVREISWDVNPKIWLGIKWLSTYYEIRPIELVHVKEKDINYNTGTMMVWYSKVDIPKTIYLLPEDLTLAKSFGPAFPEQYFFRHIQGNGKAAPGQRFGEKFWYKWWKKACDALGITGIDLYGGTRHSTVRHLIGQFSPEQIKRGSWQTNKAMERYLGPVERNQKHLIYQVSSGTKVEPIPVHSQKPKPS